MMPPPHFLWKPSLNCAVKFDLRVFSLDSSSLFTDVRAITAAFFWWTRVPRRACGKKTTKSPSVTWGTASKQRHREKQSGDEQWKGGGEESEQERKKQRQLDDAWQYQGDRRRAGLDQTQQTGQLKDALRQQTACETNFLGFDVKLVRRHRDAAQAHLALDDAVGHAHLAAEGREPHHELDGVHVVGDHDKGRLLILDQRRDVLEAELDDLHSDATTRNATQE